ncbi:hypothetical protein C4Q28_05960 [Pseudomonas sp. SWI6]|uniref:Uncharacterized protein n=1 Tax=Pseudomonas taiwanensis TaxID=470150 RepID=A0ABR6V4D3_9PSED|nr:MULTISPECIES: hypothetical protein [Pseudomonas]AGZ36903.1 hypothetical protein PVLB_20610 [Pseudomonas sp. VLB120]AVD81735.1 hypothetical protein C4Q28_05960 [Pseudomonas sp. SWI6]AVD88715.1 hypothetical protein C4Q26_16895 [Pseudomonas sp. SWI44]MBC3475363.1 hypothetical protein [Pseudomonas taiwanensis]MBC3491147.1 hypothetical protein [Pseudomonas taiwanensis]
MKYVQDRSFIATFTSVTPGYEGWLDSMEGTPRERRCQWLTVSSSSEVKSPQRFWFGYFEGDRHGYQVRAVESGEGYAHYDIWDLSGQSYIGYYAKSDEPVSWRVRVDGTKIEQPQIQVYQGVTLAAPGLAMVSVANRKPWDDHYVGVGKPNVLTFEMAVQDVNVPNFSNVSLYRRR